MKAYQLLGEDEIEVRWFDELPEEERLVLEMEENLLRKDLSPYERSQGMMRLAEAVASRLNREAQATAENSSSADENPPRGRPPKPDADAKVADEIGVSQSSLSLAKQHVAAVAKYAELKDMLQRAALDTATELDDLPVETCEQRRDTLRASAAQSHGDDQAQAPTITTATTRPRRLADPDRFWHQAMRNLSVFYAHTDKTKKVRQRAAGWGATARHAYLSALRQVQDRVTHLIGEIEQVAPEHAPEDSTGDPPRAEEPTVAVTDEHVKLRRLPAHVTQMPEGMRSAQEPERPERQDGSMDANEPTAPRRAEAPEPVGDFDARLDECIDRITTLRAFRASWTHAAELLNEEGMPTPTGVKSWNHRTLQRLAGKLGIA